MRPFRPIAPSIDGRARDYRSAEEICAPRAFLRHKRPIPACRVGQDRLIEKLCTYSSGLDGSKVLPMITNVLDVLVGAAKPMSRISLAVSVARKICSAMVW